MNFLIVKTSSLGDIIHAFPFVQALRSLEPQSSIEWVVEQPFEALVRAHPYVDHVHVIHTKQWRRTFWHASTWKDVKTFSRVIRQKQYQTVFDLQGNTKSGCVTGLAKSPLKVGLGKQSVFEWPNLLFTNRHYDPPLYQNVRDEYLFLLQQVYASKISDTFKNQTIKLTLTSEEESTYHHLLNGMIHLQQPLFMICPGSNWTNKQLSIDTLQQFLGLLQKTYKNHFVFVWGSESEKKLVQRLNHVFDGSTIIDKMSLPLLQNMMNHMNLVIAMDSLPLHLAGTTMTPTYSLFGPSSAQKYKPLGEQHRAYQGNCPYNQQFERRCPVLRTCKTGACVKNLTASLLIEDFNKWWRRLV